MSKTVFDFSGVFEHTIRLRTKGQRRPGTKTKKIRSANERAFQAKLTELRATVPPDLLKQAKLPESKLFKPVKKRGIMDWVRSKVRKPRSHKDEAESVGG